MCQRGRRAVKVGVVRRTDDSKRLAQQSIVSRVHSLTLELLFSFLPEKYYH